MKIAVTGASGFIGTELLDILNKRKDVSVIALTRDASKHEGFDSCEWCSTDYSFDSLAKVLYKVDTVIHLAGARGTENDPAKFAVNEMMTENILKGMIECGAKRIVFASTMSVYNDDELMPWKEDAPIRGRSCYGDSKANCEQLIKTCAEETGITYGIARIAQVLGEGEKRRGMMNVFIDTARVHGTLRVMGKSVAKRQYIYVKDLAEVLSILALGNSALSTDENMTINVGMPNAYTNLEIAELVNEVFENSTPIEYDDSYPETGRPFHMDITKLQDKLGYRPLDMAEALIAFKNA